MANVRGHPAERAQAARAGCGRKSCTQHRQFDARSPKLGPPPPLFLATEYLGRNNLRRSEHHAILHASRIDGAVIIRVVTKHNCHQDTAPATH